MLLLQIAALASVVAASQCGLKKLENLVTFGDSYTDEGRLGYFINHNGTAPPAGTLLPESNSTASGGYAWGRFVAKSTGAKYYNYAVAGATCSNKIISRDFPAIYQPFPSVLDYEIPAYKADLAYNELYPNRQANNTVYALWIGTNDLGYGAFLTDSQAPGTTISTYVDCIWEVFDHVYETGGRHFVLLNLVPLEQSPLYAATDRGGFADSQFWPNKTAYNTTEYQYKMLEYTTSANTMFDYGAPFHLLVKKRWPGASFSIFDAHKLLSDIHAEPAKYLDSPANVTGVYRVCDPVTRACVDSSESKASFLWFDELHPSERADEIVAKHFVDVVNGNSAYGTTYTS
ncbi:acetyl esterase [Colletotrichum truncatum]|uniref:Acetyl esterase n=1 Tax=Colletotrichum truncatum TaxID=5467 RepID=A0ACC3YMP6_COLTU|nr:acetyl esterase [Colletotrichum truncatum]KAF6792185.1 acetyl esterase [Colletotrichum truncatum]